MEGIIQFNFRGQRYSCGYIICHKAYPTYIYITFNDAALVEEFGEEICLHSDNGSLLTTNIYSDKRLELCTIIFNQVREQVPLTVIVNTQALSKRI